MNYFGDKSLYLIVSYFQYKSIIDKTVLYNLTYGVYIVGVADGAHYPAGCVIDTCFQVTADNPSVAIPLNKNNYTMEVLRRNPVFSLSIAAEDTGADVIGQFGYHSSRDVDKFAPFGYEVLEGAPLVNGKFAGRLILNVNQIIDCGTHCLVVAYVTDTVAGEGKPMTYGYYTSVIKGKASKNSPTYRGDDASRAEAEAGPAQNRHRYRCDICGYEVEFDGDVPDDYVCPLCLADASHFVKID